jgi:hypothetical protein
LTQNFQDVATALKRLDKNLLLSQSVERVGIYADRTHAPLVTNALTLEMETRWSRCFGERIKAISNISIGHERHGEDECNLPSLSSGSTGTHGG